MDDLDFLARRFPLVARARPLCPSLDKRVQEVRELAHDASSQSGHSALSLAATAQNKAALIASDCGIPDLARTLCWRHFDVYRRVQPLGAQVAKLSLEPLVNLARLHIRGSDANTAYQLLDTLYRAVVARTDAMIDGQPLSFQQLTASDDDHQALRQWLWAVLLAEGTRALVGAGRWDDAVTHARQHSGVGKRLLDGRQIAIVASARSGQTGHATMLLNESAATEPWEHSVRSLLWVYCHRAAGTEPGPHIAAMLANAVDLLDAQDPATLVSRTRIGITALDLASSNADAQAIQLRARLVTEAAANAYAAREILAHPHLRSTLVTAQDRSLTALTRSAGLDVGTIPEPSHRNLIEAASLAEDSLRAALALSGNSSP